jgi:hypothetical protein
MTFLLFDSFLRLEKEFFGTIFPFGIDLRFFSVVFHPIDIAFEMGEILRKILAFSINFIVKLLSQKTCGNDVIRSIFRLRFNYEFKMNLNLVDELRHH